jgi:hypothetical protein
MTNEPAKLEPDVSGFFSASTVHEAVKELEAAVLAAPQIDLQTRSLLAGKVNGRTILIPAGTVLTGAKHNKDSVNIVCGDITVTTDNGPLRITGYHVIPSKAGTKRAGYAHADTYWTTCWHTELTDGEAIEDEMSDESAQLQTRKQAMLSKQIDEPENQS